MIALERYPAGVETPWDQDGIMRVVLHYEGPLPPRPRPETQMEIRRALHPQLKYLWSQQESLVDLTRQVHLMRDGHYVGNVQLEEGGLWSVVLPGFTPQVFSLPSHPASWRDTPAKALQRLAQMAQGGYGNDPLPPHAELPSGFVAQEGLDHIKTAFVRKDFNFAPLVTDRLSLMCYLKIAIVSREKRGVLFSRGGDLDNRMKCVIDALRVPDQGQLSGMTPRSEEDPFFVLLEDDALVSDLEVRTEQKLEVPGPSQERNDVRLTITAIVRPTKVTDVNRSFLADFF